MGFEAAWSSFVADRYFPDRDFPLRCGCDRSRVGASELPRYLPSSRYPTTISESEDSERLRDADYTALDS